MRQVWEGVIIREKFVVVDIKKPKLKIDSNSLFLDFSYLRIDIFIKI